jgi:K+ transport systems, NAD-binding component
MNIVICGAGEVGFNLAKYLALRGHDITVIDINQELINSINDRLDVKAIVGHASHPDILKKAGLESADMLIAVTHQDEVNIVACEVAHALFNVPQKIARLRAGSYLSHQSNRLFCKENLSIDFIISPEGEVAHALSRNFAVPGAFDIIPFAEGRVRLLGIRCTLETPIVNTPISHIPSLFPEVDLSVVGIVRGDHHFIPKLNEILHAGDEVYFVCEESQIQSALVAFGHSGEPTRKLLIIGGGNIGLSLAQEIEAHFSHIRVHLIELNQKRAEYIAQRLSKAVVINGDALEGDVLQEAGIEKIDTVVCVTEDDRVNTLASILAKRLGAKKSLVLANKSTFANLVVSLGAEVAINPKTVTVSKIMQYIRKSKIHAIHSLGEEFGEVIDVDASVAAGLVGHTVGELRLEHDLLIAAILRDDQVIIPNPTTSIRVTDRVILMMSAKQARRSESVLGIN